MPIIIFTDPTFSNVYEISKLFSIILKAAQKNPMQANFEECKTSEKISDEDLKNFKKPDQPRTQAMKCFMACLGEKSGKVWNAFCNFDSYTNNK